MKYLQVILIAILISACSGTKRIVETAPKDTSELVKFDYDSIAKKIESNMNKSVLETDLDSIKENDDFHQTLTQCTIEQHELWDDLLKKHVSKNGEVDYEEFKNDRIKLYNYYKVLNLGIPNETHSKEYTLTYWINAYNAMTVDLILRNYPLKSIKDIKDPWDQRLWKLGYKWYNLNEIEHDILRKMDEPRIHFAIVCASFSCPKLQNEAFTASNLEVQLSKATEEFLSDYERNNISENSLELSKIFQWFTKDFKQNGSLIDFLNQYSKVQISEKAKIKYKDYNWNLNE
jgi:hypothetical protein